MDLRYLYDYNSHLLVGLIVVLLCVSCSSSKETAKVPVDDLPKILKEASQPNVDTTQNDQRDDVKLNYQNESTSVTIPIDPENQDFVLELNGVDKKSRDNKKQQKKQQDPQKMITQIPDSTILRDSVVKVTMAKKIKQVLEDFRRAQDLFYREDFKGALEMVNRSLETQETANALGLKGTIFFMRDEMSSAKYYWNKAVQMNPNIPVPNIPELESLIKEIKATEDLEEAEE